jgi:hypothetical protein
MYVLELVRKCNYNIYFVHLAFLIYFCTISLTILLMSHHVILCNVNVILSIISHFDYITIFERTKGAILMRIECSELGFMV